MNGFIQEHNTSSWFISKTVTLIVECFTYKPVCTHYVMSEYKIIFNGAFIVRRSGHLFLRAPEWVGGGVSL